MFAENIINFHHPFKAEQFYQKKLLPALESSSTPSPLATRPDQGQAVSESEKAAVPVCLDPESALNLLLAGNFIYDGGNEKWIIDCLEKKTDFDPLLYLKMPIA